MDFTSEQINAIKKCVEWYYIGSSYNDVFPIGGYAGTGKSTIVNKIIEILRIVNNRVIFCSLTGKAALVLRLKGLNANTIHKSFYTPFKTQHGIKFKLKKKLDSPVDLIVIDELSMVDQKTLSDIKSFKIPIIGIGDPGQLPPIFGSNEYMRDESKISCFLTQIMRQSDESGILDYAYKARNMIPIEIGKHKKCQTIRYKDFDPKSIIDYDCVLCWKNNTRRNLNTFIRSILGKSSIYQKKGEKVLCLRNNYSYKIDYKDVPIYTTNGLVLICTEDARLVNEGDGKPFVRVICRPEFSDDCEEFDLKCHPEIFDRYYNNDVNDIFIDPTGDDEDDLVHLDYGYALTVHKSQGSEWRKVLVFNEFKGSQLLYSKWLYTAITRAKNELTIVAA